MTYAISADPDQNAAEQSDQGLHYLPFHYFQETTVQKAKFHSHPIPSFDRLQLDKKTSVLLDIRQKRQLIRQNERDIQCTCILNHFKLINKTYA